MHDSIIEIKRGHGPLDEFIRFPDEIYGGYPRYVPLLKREMRLQFSDKNPFFDHADVKFFLAKRGGSTVGRVCSIINRRHIEVQRESVGFFGFFECINDPRTAGLLIDRVSAELNKEGVHALRGPMNFSTNEECGFLLEGFDLHPMLMTPYNPPYYNDLMEGCGMGKAKDLYAYMYDVAEELPEKVLRVASIAERRGVRVRPIDKKNFRSEMREFRKVYNAAWEKNWGFIPISDGELDFISERLKPIAVPEITLIAESGGETVGFLGMVPDFNFVLKKMGGRLTPWTAAKALYYSKKITDLRLMLLGIKPGSRSAGVDALLFREGFRGIKRGGYKRVEFSWILEDNLPILRIVDMIGGKLYKRYRIYEKRAG